MQYGFEKGYSQLPISEAPKVKAEIMDVLGITGRPSWLRRLRGEVEPRISEYKSIEKIFRRHGIRDIWG